MIKFRKLFTSASMIPVVFLFVLSGIFCGTRHAAAQSQQVCILPAGVTPPADPDVTAQQVEDGSATLREFALSARNNYWVLHGEFDESPYLVLHLQCLTRQEGSAYRSGSTYLVYLGPDGRVFQHGKDMALSGRQVKPAIHLAILRALGINPSDLADHHSAAAAFASIADGDGGPFNVPDIPGASGYAVPFSASNFWLVGFDLDETHLIPIADEDIDYGNPSVTASDVVDRESLKAFVTAAQDHILSLPDLSALSKVRIAFRDENGPWRHGSVYLYVLDTARNVIMFHAVFPNRFELKPLIPTARDAVTGELVLPQVIEAAKSSPEGGFLEYYWDDPTDDTDRADVPKVGYAREFSVAGLHLIIGSGFYGRAADVGPGPSTIVEATVVGDAVEGLTVEFSRAVSGLPSNWAWNTVTDAAGLFSLAISDMGGVSGYYRARATNAEGEVVGSWSSIALNRNHRQVLELTLGGGARVVRVQPLAASGPEAAAKPAFAAETLPEASGLLPNSPNPFNSATLITYQLSSAGPVKLVIYNVLGQPVRTLVNESQAKGLYQIRWDARNQAGVSLSTGVYVARLSYPGGVQTQRLLYLK